MALDDISPSTPTVEQPMIASPLRIILHIRPDIRRHSESKLKENCFNIVNAFFDDTAAQNVHRENTYIHFPSLGGYWESQVIIDYCIGDIPEGTFVSKVPLLIYIVSQRDNGLVFEKARTSPLMEENMHSSTDSLPWKSKEFIKVPQDIRTRKENELHKRTQLEQDMRRQMWGKRQVSLAADVEAKIRQNIEGPKLDIETETQSSTATSPPQLSDHLSLFELTIRLRDRPVRVLLQIKTDGSPTGIRKQSTIASRGFLQLMMQDQYQTTNIYRRIRASHMMVKNELECWILVDYWIGRSTRTENPPFLTMVYRGDMRDGLMKFQPTGLSNTGTQAVCSVFLAKFPLGHKGSSVTIEGTEPTGNNQPSGEKDLFSSINSDKATASQSELHTNALSDGSVSGDWVVSDYQSGHTLDSWEFVSDS
ncbi:hypothetical protein N7456_005722 [Penicillium angulare]|uniref:Uncharacterized protein n=1 Tax=Penicillium angulare TaxID=116970 RepID=A0A9W9FZ19_9EURO|nr:hypothetical protein N7456_005722 [Penicillium angulare]